ncbi:hypothetical protein C2857_007746 [Epichloe festucae Fl1]|uniref:Hydrophobin n=1 Tax=Epichloe festucae (strain Fl1) TaxID=877507 RepID=A0A7S9KMT5_EPIFF|nr:hypothetical protein C2857_007746 [Epichloe festucae Fl1]
MKYATVIAALAAAAIAAPTNGGGSSDQCNNKPNTVCCTGLLGLVPLCALAVLGQTCSGSSYCCQSAPQNGIINIGLECVKLLS